MDGRRGEGSGGGGGGGALLRCCCSCWQVDAASLSLFGAAPPRRHTYSNRKELLCSAAAPALSCFSFLVLVKQHQGVGWNSSLLWQQHSYSFYLNSSSSSASPSRAAPSSFCSFSSVSFIMRRLIRRQLVTRRRLRGGPRPVSVNIHVSLVWRFVSDRGTASDSLAKCFFFDWWNWADAKIKIKKRMKKLVEEWRCSVRNTADGNTRESWDLSDEMNFHY